MVEQVAVLHPRDTAFFDEATLDALSRELGPGVAENILCRALEDIAARLVQMRREYAEGDDSALRKSVRALIPIAEQVGLPGLSAIGRDVLTCIDRGDGVSIAATLCRLLRSSEMAISCADLGLDLSI